MAKGNMASEEKGADYSFESAKEQMKSAPGVCTYVQSPFLLPLFPPSFLTFNQQTPLKSCLPRASWCVRRREEPLPLLAMSSALQRFKQRHGVRRCPA